MAQYNGPLSIGEQLGDDRPCRVDDFAQPAGEFSAFRARMASPQASDDYRAMAVQCFQDGRPDYPIVAALIDIAERLEAIEALGAGSLMSSTDHSRTCRRYGCGKELPPRRRKFCSDECAVMSRWKYTPEKIAALEELEEAQDLEHIELLQRQIREQNGMRDRHWHERNAVMTGVPSPPGVTEGS